MPPSHHPIALPGVIDTLPDISKTPPSQRVERDRLLSKLGPHDANSVFKVIDAIEADPALSLNCHDIAHDIGHKAYELYGFSAALNFTDAARLNHASIQDVCAGGYDHGLLEEAALHRPEFAHDPGVMCVDVPTESRASCFHGVGHALMFLYDRDTNSSLEACRITRTVGGASRCFEGVWMELFWGNTDHTGSNSIGFDTDMPLAPCKATARDAKPACFLYSTFGYLRVHKRDYAGAVRLCTTNKLLENDSEFCLKGVGITMVSRFKARHLEGSEVFVKGLSTGQKTAFYQGVFGYANLSGMDSEEIKNTCALFQTDKTICEDVITSQW